MISQQTCHLYVMFISLLSAMPFPFLPVLCGVNWESDLLSAPGRQVCPINHLEGLKSLFCGTENLLLPLNSPDEIIDNGGLLDGVLRTVKFQGPFRIRNRSIYLPRTLRIFPFVLFQPPPDHMSVIFQDNLPPAPADFQPVCARTFPC